MANISITYAWGKHESISVEIYAEDSFPDAIDEARAQAVRGLKETLNDVCGIEGRTNGPAE